MAQKKKLQVFVSSTYTDLIEERQAAVEAILTAGHIPAGMELFASGDESQMTVIRRWIDECDVYLLLLGGRYGSIEPTTGKSYTHLEYDYAVEKGKPHFAVVMDDSALKKKVKKLGMGVAETRNIEKLENFRATVMNNVIKPWTDKRDIQLTILQKLSEYDRREDLVGWVRGGQEIDSGAIAEQIASLSKANAELRNKVANQGTTNESYNGLVHEEVEKLLLSTKLEKTMFKIEFWDILTEISSIIQYRRGYPTLMHFLIVWNYMSSFEEVIALRNSYASTLFDEFLQIGIVDEYKEDFISSDKKNIIEVSNFFISDSGRRFILRNKLYIRENQKEEEILKLLNGIDFNISHPFEK